MFPWEKRLFTSRDVFWPSPKVYATHTTASSHTNLCWQCWITTRPLPRAYARSTGQELKHSSLIGCQPTSPHPAPWHQTPNNKRCCSLYLSGWNIICDSTSIRSKFHQRQTTSPSRPLWHQFTSFIAHTALATSFTSLCTLFTNSSISAASTFITNHSQT